MPETEPLAVLLKRFRLAAGLSQEALAERAQLSRDAVSAIERGRRTLPYPETLARLAAALSLDASERRRLLASGAAASLPAERTIVVSKGVPPGSRGEPASDTSPNNLPIRLTRFIGREAELKKVTELLFGEGSAGRLVTLIGPGGVGKTRLAIEVCRGLLNGSGGISSFHVTDELRDGVWLVELAGINEQDIVASTLAAALDVREQPGQAATATLIDVVHAKRMLVILDNCEHVIDACATLVLNLLQHCPGMRVLATSREALGIPGEVIRPVPALTVPELPAGGESSGELEACDSIELFVDRAALVRPEFALTSTNNVAIASICRQLDGIPLAIELAAARVNALDVWAIARGLADRFQLLTGPKRGALPRQQTLRASVEWSYQLLSADEQSFFNRAAVFVGGLAPQAASPVTGLPDPDASLVLLPRLVDKSLIMLGEGRGGLTRYRLLETLREYAAQQLAQIGEASAARERHARYYIDWLTAAAAHIEGPDQLEWLNRVEDDLDNLRAALDWFAEADSAVECLQVAWALALIGWLRGHLNEVDSRLTSILALPSCRDAPLDLRAGAMLSAGYIAWLRGEIGRARQLLEDGLDIFQRLDHRHGVARARTWLGVLLTGTDEQAKACTLLRDAHQRFRQLGDDFWTARAATNLGRCLTVSGALLEAASYLEEALRLRRVLGDTRGVANTLTHMSDAKLAHGDHIGAKPLLEEAVSLARSIDDRFVMLLAISGLGRQSCLAGDLPLARSYLREALDAAQRDGFTNVGNWTKDLLARIAEDDQMAARALVRLV